MVKVADCGAPAFQALQEAAVAQQEHAGDVAGGIKYPGAGDDLLELVVAQVLGLALYMSRTRYISSPERTRVAGSSILPGPKDGGREPVGGGAKPADGVLAPEGRETEPERGRVTSGGGKTGLEAGGVGPSLLGRAWPPGERRQGLRAGPFTACPGRCCQR